MGMKLQDGDIGNMFFHSVIYKHYSEEIEKANALKGEE